jgi:hypothetical protein
MSHPKGIIWGRYMIEARVKMEEMACSAQAGGTSVSKATLRQRDKNGRHEDTRHLGGERAGMRVTLGLMDQT